MGDYGDKQTSTTDQQTDLNASQADQQPAGQQSDTAQGGEASGDSWKSDSADQETGQGDYGSAGQIAQGETQGDTMTGAKSDSDTTGIQQPVNNAQTGGFVGSKTDGDDSDRLIDKDPPLEGE